MLYLHIFPALNFFLFGRNGGRDRFLAAELSQSVTAIKKA